MVSGPAPGPMASCEDATQLVPDPQAEPARKSARSPVDPVRLIEKATLLPAASVNWKTASGPG